MKLASEEIFSLWFDLINSIAMKRFGLRNIASISDFLLPLISPSFHASFCYHSFVLFDLSPCWCLSFLFLSRSFLPTGSPPSLHMHYLQCGKCPNFLPRLIIRCIRQGHGLASGSDSPGASWERGMRLGGVGGIAKKELGEVVVSRCPCAASWREVLNGGLCRITLVACCIIDITGSVTLHWPASQLLQQTLVDMHPLYLFLSPVLNFLFPARCYPALISFAFTLTCFFSFPGFCLQP